ncbi:MAG: TonB-dependent receptor, partial [Bacteroidota bacterium]
AEALNDVQVMAGGPPPEYGGRIGGILDLALRDGTRDRLSGTAGTGTLGSHLSLESPVGGATSILVSGRREYPEPAVPFLEYYGTPSRQGSSEVIVKLTNILSASSRLYLSGYLGRDSYTNNVNGTQQHLDNNFSWGNSAANARWIGIATPSLFLQASAVYTRYDLSLEQVLTRVGTPLPAGVSFSSEFAIEDMTIRAVAEHYYDLEHTFRAGVELTRHRMKGGISEFATQNSPLSFNGSAFWETAVYVQDQWRLFPGMTAELGARATSFTGGQGSMSAVDPRFSLLFSPGEETRVYASFSTVNQFIHSYRNSGVFLLYPAIFWYPSGENVKPSTSLQFRVGAEKGWNGDEFVGSAECYYRVVENLHDFGLDTTLTQTRNLEDDILYGTGKSYGLAFTLRRRIGDLTGSIGYTLSWGSNRFPSLNGGNAFAPRFDRRHEVQFSASFAPDQDWRIGLLAVLAIESINLFPQPVAQLAAYQSPKARSAAGTPAWLVDVNGERYPGFQRLELQVLRAFSLAQMHCTLSLRLMNAYGLLDPFVWQLQDNPDVRLKWNAALQNLKLFPLFPTVGLTVKF